MSNVRQQVVVLCRRIRAYSLRGLVSARAAGFTIIEVLIVLGITALLFISAATAISGKQNQTAFDQALQQIRGQIEQTINDISIGYYPNASDFQCSAGGSGPNILAGSNTQGTNKGCIFVGKAIQFKVQGFTPERYETYAIAGLQKDAASGQDVQSLAQAKPLVVPNSSTFGQMESGLTTYSMVYNNGAADIAVGTVAFTTSFASYNNGSLVSGSQQVSVVPVAPVSGTGLDETTVVGTSDIDTNLATGVVNPTNGVTICFASSGTNQSGKLVIGGNNHPLAVTLTLKANQTCS